MSSVNLSLEGRLKIGIKDGSNKGKIIERRIQNSLLINKIFAPNTEVKRGGRKEVFVKNYLMDRSC